MLNKIWNTVARPQRLPYLIRFSYHKCLTRYMGVIFDDTKHFFSHQTEFIQHIVKKKKPRFLSLNNGTAYPGHKTLVNARMVHLIRHPKDLIISGYHYHKKGSELWNTFRLPKPKFYRFSLELDHVLNDQEKKLLHPELTYQQLLENLSFEKGMMAEMVWLKYIKTFNPLIYYQSSLLPTYRFEEIMQDPVEGVRKICQHWQLSEKETAYYCERASHYNQNPNYPIRNSAAYQYKEVYTKELNSFFEQQFNKLVTRLDYPD